MPRSPVILNAECVILNLFQDPFPTIVDTETSSAWQRGVQHPCETSSAWQRGVQHPCLLPLSFPPASLSCHPEFISGSISYYCGYWNKFSM